MFGGGNHCVSLRSAQVLIPRGIGASRVRHPYFNRLRSKGCPLARDRPDDLSNIPRGSAVYLPGHSLEKWKMVCD
jgi:hypothetical protein